MGARIIIINTGAANIHSVAKALARVGADALVTSDPADLAGADAAVLPGVGASDAALRALDTAGLREPVKRFAASGRPLLCVCLGMQLLFERSEEGDLPCLGLLRGDVRLLPGDMKDADGNRLKVPHMGWNSIKFTAQGRRHPVFSEVPDGSHFYFVHSYCCVPSEAADIAGTVSYGLEICAAVVRGEVIGTQFHPEKSGDAGLMIYRNFVKHAAKVAAR
jgi:glutamine amidotransferase